MIATLVAFGLGMIACYFAKKKSLETRRKNILQQFDKKKESGTQIVRATLAEVVDYRALFNKKDAESQAVVDFLEQIKPEQYVRKLTDSTRRIKTTG
jgi:hypothetical protein